MSLSDIGGSVYIVVCYLISHKTSIISLYETFEYARFGFHITNKIGIIDVISNAIKKKYMSSEILVMEIKTESSMLGDFEIIDIL